MIVSALSFFCVHGNRCPIGRILGEYRRITARGCDVYTDEHLDQRLCARHLYDAGIRAGYYGR
jgi:hypothetical protein